LNASNTLIILAFPPLALASLNKTRTKACALTPQGA
jgi:hypothetical protein